MPADLKRLDWLIQQVHREGRTPEGRIERPGPAGRRFTGRCVSKCALERWIAFWGLGDQNVGDCVIDVGPGSGSGRVGQNAQEQACWGDKHAYPRLT
jgi:hypothetical protein